MTLNISKRTDPSQFLGYEELLIILEVEAKRPIIEEKRMKKLIDYSLAEEWLKEIRIDTELFSYNKDIREVLKEGNEVKKVIAQRTLEKVSKEEESLMSLIKKIADYLGEEDKLEKSDFIFVFGGKNLGRMQKAVELWREGWAEKIWISGSHPVYEEYEAEALTFKKWAVKDGVPESAIITESQSLTIADNIRRSLNLMDEKGISFKKMVLVISWYAQKRAWMTMERHVKAKLININAKMEKDNLVSRETWYKSDYGINIIFNEFLKMRIHDGLIMNGDI